MNLINTLESKFPVLLLLRTIYLSLSRSDQCFTHTNFGSGKLHVCVFVYVLVKILGEEGSRCFWAAEVITWIHTSLRVRTWPYLTTSNSLAGVAVVLSPWFYRLVVGGSA